MYHRAENDKTNDFNGKLMQMVKTTTLNVRINVVCNVVTGHSGFRVGD